MMKEICLNLLLYNAIRVYKTCVVVGLILCLSTFFCNVLIYVIPPLPRPSPSPEVYTVLLLSLLVTVVYRSGSKL